jgi:hypothetical protein
MITLVLAFVITSLIVGTPAAWHIRTSHREIRAAELSVQRLIAAMNAVEQTLMAERSLTSAQIQLAGTRNRRNPDA